MALAVDGEALPGVRSVAYRNQPKALTNYSPRR
jgi:undecaprenyl-diphosphatase